jgi:hypothetical protein
VALKIIREASFAFAVERAIGFTNTIFKLYRGLCRVIIFTMVYTEGNFTVALA